MTQSRYGHIGAVAVHLVAVRVGVAGEVEPVGRHPLAVARARRAAGRRPSRTRPATRRRRTRRSPPASAAGRSGRASRGGSASPGPPRATGASFSFSSRARTNASIGLRAQPCAVVVGTSGRFGATNAQCVPHVAPCSTHRFSVSICSGVSLRMSVRRRHHLVGVVRRDPANQLALRRLARHDDGDAVLRRGTRRPSCRAAAPPCAPARPGRGSGSRRRTGSAARRGRSPPSPAAAARDPGEAQQRDEASRGIERKVDGITIIRRPSDLRLTMHGCTVTAVAWLPFIRPGPPGVPVQFLCNFRRRR